MKTVNALDYVRSNCGRFFRSGEPTSAEIVQALVGDALLLGVTRLTILQFRSWWIVGGDADWVGSEADNDVFSRIVPFPEAGVNSMRSEILVAAFSSTAITSFNGEPRVIAGSVSEENDVWRHLPSAKEWARIIAFRLDSS